MLSKMGRIVFLSAALAMSGCASIPGTGAGGSVTVQDVINACISRCQFVVDAAAVAQIIGVALNNPAIVGGAVTVGNVSSAICTALNAKGGLTTASLGGVPITGHYLQGRRRGASLGGVEITGHPVGK